MSSAQRKDDHVRLAMDQNRAHPGHNQFDDVTFIHHALAGIDRDDVCLTTSFAGLTWQAPLYINAMTGGSAKTGLINRDLATAAREAGVAIASGSMNTYFKDPSCADTFRVLRTHNPDGFVLANINATTTPDNARRAIDLLHANALQIHINTAQETPMPEGDRSFGSWPAQIEKIAAAVDVPVIVKEVGNGLSRQTIHRLADLGVAAADVAGRGGTDFARIENGRRPLADYTYLHNWGQSTAACLLDTPNPPLPLLASGGVRHPLDIARCLALGARAVGVSGGFLRTLLDHGVPALITQITTWLDHLTALHTMLGAPTPTHLTTCDLLIHGTLRDFCTDRGIDTTHLAQRTTTTTTTNTTNTATASTAASGGSTASSSGGSTTSTTAPATSSKGAGTTSTASTATTSGSGGSGGSAAGASSAPTTSTTSTTSTPSITGAGSSSSAAGAGSSNSSSSSSSSSGAVAGAGSGLSGAGAGGGAGGSSTAASTATASDRTGKTP